MPLTVNCGTEFAFRNYSLALAAFRLSLLLLLAVPSETRGNFIQAASVALADVQTAVNSAQDGDTVLLPTGTANWTTNCLVTNSITIQGAGSDLTVITNTQSGSLNTGARCVFIVNLASNLMTRITGIGFDGNKTANGICIWGPEWGFFQVDHCVFAHFYGVAIQPCILQGLINACIFTDDFMPIEVTPTSYQNDSWLRPLSLGTTNCVVVENCVTLSYVSTWMLETNTGASYSQGNGARTVYRYNTWTNFNTNLSFYPILDMHGNMLQVTNSITGLRPSTTIGTNYGAGRGTVQFEVYENTFVDLVNKRIRPVHLRGGTALIYSNTYTAPANDYFEELGPFVQEEDGSCRNDFLTNYPGYDQHWINWWSNTFNGTPSETNFAYSCTGTNGDNIYVIPGTNLFFAETPFANPAVTSYTPLIYPHPLVTAELESTSNSVPPVFQTVQQTDSNIAFTWSAIVGKNYQFQTTTNLNGNNWQNCEPPITATNSIMSWSNTIGSDPQRFYRLLVE